jgi:hypothetical protein
MDAQRHRAVGWSDWLGLLREKALFLGCVDAADNILDEYVQISA